MFASNFNSCTHGGETASDSRKLSDALDPLLDCWNAIMQPSSGWSIAVIFPQFSRLPSYVTTLTYERLQASGTLDGLHHLQIDPHQTNGHLCFSPTLLLNQHLFRSDKGRDWTSTSWHTQTSMASNPSSDSGGQTIVLELFLSKYFRSIVGDSINSSW